MCTIDVYVGPKEVVPTIFRSFDAKLNHSVGMKSADCIVNIYGLSVKSNFAI